MPALPETVLAADADPIGFLRESHREIEMNVRTLLHYVDWTRCAVLKSNEERDVVEALDRLDRAIKLHLRDEEESLFPRLRTSEDGATGLAGPVFDEVKSDWANTVELYEEASGLIRKWISERSLSFLDEWNLMAALKRLANGVAYHAQVEEEEIFGVAKDVLCPTCIRDITLEMMWRRGLH